MLVKHNMALFLPKRLFVISLIGLLLFLPSSTSALQSSVQPRFEPVDCWFGVPDGVEVSCGYVEVPEDRTQPMTPENSIRLAVTVLHMPGADPTMAPIFYLEGGPGASGIQALFNDKAWWETLSPLAETRDLIAIDQRGIGYSIPSLDCLPSEDLAGCRERLVTEGINLAAYNTPNNAADINDIRLALHYGEINVYGGSYGTQLALTVMRDYPQGIRSMVLDSVVPLPVLIDKSYHDGFIAALDQLFQSCKADASCNTAYPDLESTFYNLMDQLKSNPVIVTVGTTRARVRATAFASILREALYYIELIPYLPRLIDGTARGELNTLAYVISNLPLGNLSDGMFLSVYCAEETQFLTEQEIEEEINRLPPSMRDYARADISGMVESCRMWDVPRASDFEKEPVTSDVPTLLVTGQYDPITRLPWAELAAETLSQSYVFEIPGQGHGALRSACAREIAIQFFNNPSTEPDTSCIDLIPPPAWVTE